jgi:hypothetical protein
MSTRFDAIHINQHICPTPPFCDDPGDINMNNNNNNINESSSLTSINTMAKLVMLDLRHERMAVVLCTDLSPD